MKFKLQTVNGLVSEERKEEFKNYFEFEPYRDVKDFYRVKEPSIIEINRIEDLMKIVNDSGYDVIVSNDTITIYNDYNE